MSDKKNVNFFFENIVAFDLNTVGKSRVTPRQLLFYLFCGPLIDPYWTSSSVLPSLPKGGFGNPRLGVVFEFLLRNSKMFLLPRSPL